MTRSGMPDPTGGVILQDIGPGQQASYGQGPNWSGQPPPIAGVVPPPGVPGSIGSYFVIDPVTGNIVLNPPTNVFQIAKGAAPQSLQIFEYYTNSTTYDGFQLSNQNGGPVLFSAICSPTGNERPINIQFPYVSIGTDLTVVRNLLVTAGLSTLQTAQVTGSQSIGATAPAATASLLIAKASTGAAISITDTTKIAGYGGTGISLSGRTQLGANGTAIPGPPLRGTGADGPTTGFSAWWYCVMNGFQGGWIPIYS